MGAIFENIPKKKIVTETIIETVEVPVYIGELGTFTDTGSAIFKSGVAGQYSNEITLPDGTTYVTYSCTVNLSSDTVISASGTLYPGNSKQATYKNSPALFIKITFNENNYIKINLENGYTDSGYGVLAKSNVIITAYGESA